MRALSCLVLSSLTAALAWGCAAQHRGSVPAAPALAAGAPPEPPPPVAPPLPGGSGCVESRELKAFVLALEAERQRARTAALSATLAPINGQAREHRSVFEESVQGLHIGQVYESNGQRYAAVAQLAAPFPPPVPLVQQDNTLRPLEERPRAHPVPLLVCGGPACPSTSAVSLPPLRWIAVPFAQEWQLGPPLSISYDFWWAQVSYDRAQKCPASASH